MIPNGCFGSSLAYSPKGNACLACAHRTACGEIVNKRYPTLMRLLARFSDSRGVPMAEQWLSPADKKRLKERRAERAKREATLMTFGSIDLGDRLRAAIDDRAATHLDKCIEARVNPMTAPIAKLQSVSKPLGSALQAILKAPTHRTTIERAIASDSGLSASTAARETSAVLSLLKRCGRIVETNSIVEIK